MTSKNKLKATGNQSVDTLVAMGQEHRWKILCLLLAHGELSVMQIIFKLRESMDAVDQPCVSRHLAVLRQAGLINNKRAGRMQLYTLSDRWAKAERAVALLLGKEATLMIEKT